MIGVSELKFNVKTPYAKFAKIYTKYFCHMTKMAAMSIYGFCHMTKMAAMSIYGKNPLKIFFSRTRRPMT